MRAGVGIVAVAASGCSLIDALGDDSRGGDASIGDAQTGWISRSPLEFQRTSFGVAVVANKVYVAGGTPDGPNFPGFTDEYDPATDTWARKLLMPTHRVFRGGTNAVVDGIAWFVGGLFPGGCSDVTEGYDPSSNTWTVGLVIPQGLCSNTVLALGPHVFSLGGDGNPNTVHRYDPAANLWEVRPTPQPNPRALATGVAVAGKLYLIGGTNLPAAVDIYDPVVDLWSQGAPLPTPRTDLAAAVIGTRIYVAGGIDDRGQAVDVVEIYDPEANSWTRGTPLPRARSSLGLVGVGNVLFAIGGTTNGPSSEVVRDVDSLVIE